MGDPAGEDPDPLHALRLEVRGLELAAPGEVARDLAEAYVPVVRSPERHHLARTPEPAPVLPQVPALILGAAGTESQGPLEIRHTCVAVLRHEEHVARLALNLAFGVPEDPLGPRAPRLDDTVGVRGEDGVVGRVGHQEAVGVFRHRLSSLATGGCINGRRLSARIGRGRLVHPYARSHVSRYRALSSGG